MFNFNINIRLKPSLFCELKVGNSIGNILESSVDCSAQSSACTSRQCHTCNCNYKGKDQCIFYNALSFSLT
jgi:hypothetical protein